MVKHPRTIDEYLATVSTDKRAALQKLRKTIRAAAPGAEECISYGIPTFKLGGKGIAAFGAWGEHCSFYPGGALQALDVDLTGYDTSKGTIRFHPDKPLPASFVKRLVRANIARKAAR